MTLPEHAEWPFTKLVFAIVLCAAYACAAAALVYPVYMYSGGH
jgi:hypothetical protein